MNGGERRIYEKKNSVYWSSRRDKVLLAGIVVSKWICVLLGLAAPLLYRFFMNQVIVESRNDRLVYVVLGYVFLYLAMTGVGVMGHFCDNKLKNKLRFRLKSRMLTICRKMELSEYDRYDIGDMRNRIEVDEKKLESFFDNHVIKYCFAVFSIAAMGIMMLSISWPLAIFGAAGMGITFVSSNVVGARLNALSDRYRTDYGEFEGTILHSLHNWKEIKANGLEEQQAGLLDAKWKKIAECMKKQAVCRYLASGFVALNLFVVTRLGMYLL